MKHFTCLYFVLSHVRTLRLHLDPPLFKNEVVAEDMIAYSRYLSALMERGASPRLSHHSFLHESPVGSADWNSDAGSRVDFQPSREGSIGSAAPSSANLSRCELLPPSPTWDSDADLPAHAFGPDEPDDAPYGDEDAPEWERYTEYAENSGSESDSSVSPNTSYPFEMLEIARRNAEVASQSVDGSEDPASSPARSLQGAMAGEYEGDDVAVIDANIHVLRRIWFAMSSLRQPHMGQESQNTHDPTESSEGHTHQPTYPFSRLEYLEINAFDYLATGRYPLFPSPLPSVIHLCVSFRLSKELMYVWQANMLEVAMIAPNIRFLELSLEEGSIVDGHYEEWMSHIPPWEHLEEVHLYLRKGYKVADTSFIVDFCGQWGFRYLYELAKSFVTTNVREGVPEEPAATTATEEAGTPGSTWSSSTLEEDFHADFKKLVLNLPDLEEIEWSGRLPILVGALHAHQVLQYGRVLVSVETMHSSA
ncbi:hypothetical protein P389DRAFT_196630 [Cystobasidium minutum MCA 4210]|uniref:uncharacterized protein n=1 Tax=Cystobasidium minutum MCA 4210 TaxID=1397322 RepID=UPI0034CDB01A|eukprot:jgi/Rhomi1/196630/gm1.4844_g